MLATHFPPIIIPCMDLLVLQTLGLLSNRYRATIQQFEELHSGYTSAGTKGILPAAWSLPNH